ncbi:MAG: hypothetical protein K6T34_01940 [Thermoflavifilum sp.]|nr:hypothetical protein [Thermoflavifilum sp.]
MKQILQYSLLDLLRSRWMIGYGIMLFLLTTSMLYLTGDYMQVIISLMYVMLYLIPLLTLVIGIMYGYQIREYISWILAHPLSRKQVFSAYYFSLSFSLMLYFLVGVGIPFFIAGIWQSSAIGALGMLLLCGSLLIIVFSGISLSIVFAFDNKLAGLGIALLFWFTCTILYDAFFLIAVIAFQEYPLDVWAIIATILNPVDMSRILMIFHVNLSALLGYTGAVIRQDLGAWKGTLGIILGYTIWIIMPFWFYLKLTTQKDF